jgi:hypothetical protein
VASGAGFFQKPPRISLNCLPSHPRKHNPPARASPGRQHQSALSSVVEHILHTDGVAGSNPAARTRPNNQRVTLINGALGRKNGNSIGNTSVKMLTAPPFYWAHLRTPCPPWRHEASSDFRFYLECETQRAIAEASAFSGPGVRTRRKPPPKGRGGPGYAIGAKASKAGAAVLTRFLYSPATWRR